MTSVYYYLTINNIFQDLGPDPRSKIPKKISANYSESYEIKKNNSSMREIKNKIKDEIISTKSVKVSKISFLDDEISIIFSNLLNDKYLANLLYEILGSKGDLTVERGEKGKNLDFIL